MRLGPRTRVSTASSAPARRGGATWDGDLYLRGGGDFTFGTASFARKAYGSSASVERLAAQLRRSGLRRIDGQRLRRRVALPRQRRDAVPARRCAPIRCSAAAAPTVRPPSWSARSRTARAPRSASTAASSTRRASKAQSRPARFAARGLIRALRSAGIRVDGGRRRRAHAAAGTRAGGDRLAADRAARRAGQPAVGQLRGRQHLPADRRARRRRRLRRGRRPRRQAHHPAAFRDRPGDRHRARARRSRTGRRRVSS